MGKKIVGSLVLLRGLPGSGKSTFGKVILPWPESDEFRVISADDFFINENGEYIFNPAKLSEAHSSALKSCEVKMQLKISTIVVANTFVTEDELSPYFDLANQYNYKVYSVIVENRHGNKNIHGVPDETLTKMKNNFSISLI